jgi:spermidine/putrescine transport system substrate-binding protein
MKNNKILFYIFLLIFTFSLYIFYIFFLKNNKSISIMAWNNSLDIKSIKRFEQETGINVNIKYYNSNEELISKLSITNKNIDLIFPSDYIVLELLKLKLIKPIDEKKINCFSFLIKDLLQGVYFNKQYYGVPHEWGVFGLVVNESIRKNITNNNDIYKAFFEGNYNNIYLRLATLNDIPTICNIAYNYYKNFFKKNKIYYKKNLFTILYEILKKQKKYIAVYTDESITSLFIDDIIDIALMQSYRYVKMLKDFPNLQLEFILPNYHILQATEYCSISSSSNKEDLCYQFINFILDKEQLLINLQENLFFSPRTDVIDQNNNLNKKLQGDLKKNKKIIQTTEAILNKKDMVALWMKLKS